VGHWEVDARSVHALLEERREILFGALEDPQRLSELEAEVRELRYLLGRAEARLDMSAQTEFMLREDLQRERERSDKLEAELREAQSLRPEPGEQPATPTEREGKGETPPDTERRSWWQRWFGASSIT
jgi:hypothetical protein